MTRPDLPTTPKEEVSPSIRAQLLATEHWSLLASRSTTQNELLVRIAIFLTLVSASVVSLALIGQATDFDGRFDAFTIVLFSILLLVGTLTMLRVFNGSVEDQAYVVGMNRLRLRTPSWTLGSTATSSRPRTMTRAECARRTRILEDVSDVVQVLASSSMFLLVVDLVVAGCPRGVGGKRGRWLGRGYRDSSGVRWAPATSSRGSGTSLAGSGLRSVSTSRCFRIPSNHLPAKSIAGTRFDSSRSQAANSASNPSICSRSARPVADPRRAGARLGPCRRVEVRRSAALDARVTRGAVKARGRGVARPPSRKVVARTRNRGAERKGELGNDQTEDAHIRRRGWSSRDHAGGRHCLGSDPRVLAE